MNDLERVKAFEKRLDEALESRPSLRRDPAATLLLALNGMDFCYGQNHDAGWFRKGLSILVPHLGKAPATGEPDMEELLRDIHFASHYFSLREALYYTYNVPGAMKWSFGAKDVYIEFADRSIPRQFYHTANGAFIGSIGLFRDFEGQKRIEEIIKTAEIVSDEPAPDELSELITQEIELKLKGYYTLLDEDAAVRLGRYTYAEFLLVYKHLIGNALIQRYIGRVRKLDGAVVMERPKLVAMVADHSGLSADVCGAILDDITAPMPGSKGQVDPIYFALHALPGERIAMCASDFLVHEGIVNVLRLSALRDPENFLANVSGPLGHALTGRVRSMFERNGFVCKQDISLNGIGPGLPDLDLAVVSVEKTLGYVVYLCEIKNPLPPIWAKDQLRVLGKESVAKAFKQLDKIAKVFAAPEGVTLLRSFFPKNGLPHMKDGYVVALHTLIVTSHNAGMFFNDEKHTVIDYRTLERIVDAADGDVTYIDRVLRDMDQIADNGMKIVEAEVDIGELRVRHQGVALGALTEFRKNEYKSAGVDIAHLEEFIKDGASPFDWHLKADNVPRDN